MGIFLLYLKVFAVGGGLCALGPVIDRPDQAHTGQNLAFSIGGRRGVGSRGPYGPLVDLAGAGATVPLTGFVTLLAEGGCRAVAAKGGAGRLHRRPHRVGRRHLRRDLFRFPGGCDL